MAFTTAGLTNGGVTTHYRFSYDTALGGPDGVEPARTNAAIAACEADYNLMHGWSGGGLERHQHDGPGDHGQQWCQLER
jgi:hypothetical protein